MMRLILGVVVSWVCVAQALGGSVSRGSFAEVRLFEAPAAFRAETCLALNDLATKDKDVGYKIISELRIQPLWADNYSEFLLKFNLLNPKLHLRGKHPNADYRPFNSIWDSHKNSNFYVHWKHGLIQTAYLDSSEPVDILNYKKSLISLFQFQIIDGEYNETDISGTCDVLYDSISTDVFRKIKRNCVVAGEESPAEGSLKARRLTRYTLSASARALESVFADELVELDAGAGVGVKARSWTRLQLRPAPPPPPAAAHASLAAAVAALPAHLAPHALALAGEAPPHEEMSLEEAVRSSRAALLAEEAGAGGRAEDARAALALLPALRAATTEQLRALLESDDAYPMLSGLCRMLGLAGTRAAHAAADAALQLGARDPLRALARAYLAGLALAAAPRRGAVAAAARLAADARDPGVAAAALLAASAAAARLAPDPLADTLRDDIAKSLARCKDDACRAVRLQALGHLRREDGAELLLEHAARGGRAPALAALDALAAMPPSALHYARRLRLERIALGGNRTLEVRAAALDLLLARSAARPLPLLSVALALQRSGPRELRRVFWQRLRALADTRREVREFLAMLPPELTSWHAQALGGTSMALERGTGWRAGGWAARLASLQVAAGALLRRGTVELRARAPDNTTLPLLSVEVWTRGLEALAGGAEPADPRLYEGEQPEAAAAGGLGLAVGGVHLPPVELFNSQAELLGHVWAGTGSAPTAVLRALRELPGVRGHVPLLAGVRATVHARAALAVAMDAHAQVSLWSRNARSALELRLGGAAAAALRARTAWGSLAARAHAEAAPRLRIAADLDFYDQVALCVRVRTDDHLYEHFSSLESSLGARPLVVRRARNTTLAAPGRTLALGRAPDAACRALTAADPDD